MRFMIAMYQRQVETYMRRAGRSVRFANRMSGGYSHDVSLLLAEGWVRFAREDRKLAQKHGLTTVEVW